MPEMPIWGCILVSTAPVLWWLTPDSPTVL